MKDSAPSPRRLQYLRDYRRRKRSIRLWQVCLLAGLFALWELTTRLGLSDGFLTSSPSRMAGTLQSLWHSGDLWRHIGTSCLETVVGFTAGTLLGTAIAVAMWWWEKLARNRYCELRHELRRLLVRLGWHIAFDRLRLLGPHVLRPNAVRLQHEARGKRPDDAGNGYLER